MKKYLKYLLVLMILCGCDGYPGPDHWFDIGLCDAESLDTMTTHMMILDDHNQTLLDVTSNSSHCLESPKTEVNVDGLNEDIIRFTRFDILANTFNHFDQIEGGKGTSKVSYEIPEKEYTLFQKAFENYLEGNITKLSGEMIIEEKERHLELLTLDIEAGKSIHISLELVNRGN